MIRYLPVCSAFASLLVACAGSQPEVSAPQVAQDQYVTPSAPTDQPKPNDDPTSGTISISSDIQKACGIVDSSAYFAFDSASVRSQDRTVLRALAECFVSGPLKGRRMSLVGHADPRGPADYNLALGGRRAGSVKLLVVAESLSDSNVSTTSRGAMDATGTDEASWARDRTVEVELGN